MWDYTSGNLQLLHSYTSSGWYRKYSDGWIEQGILVSFSVNPNYQRNLTKDTAFLTAFSSAVWGYMESILLTESGTSRTERLSIKRYYDSTPTADSHTYLGTNGTFSFTNTAVRFTYGWNTSTASGAVISPIAYFVVWGK